ncbi:MAG TPA: hypothetical protein VLK85_19975 [Ramlibacter sp.]|nr:hypothetical protein [Ramlibacter sp.]
MSQFEAQLQRGLCADQVRYLQSEVPHPTRRYGVSGPEPLTARQAVKLAQSL